MKNLISIKDLGRDEVERLLAFAEEMLPYVRERRRYEIPSSPQSMTPFATLLFLENSIRTYGSFDTAARYVGFNTRAHLGIEQTSIPKGESFANTVRMLSFQQMADILIMRTKWEGAPRFAIETIQANPNCQTSVINGGDGCNRHPSQTLLDLFTIKQRLGRLNDFTLGLVGDISHSRVAHDLLEAARLFGFRIGIISPPDTQPAPDWLQGVKVAFVSDDLVDLKHCEFVYLLRLQKERITDPVERQRAVLKFQVTPEILDQHCRPDVLVLHAQPIDQKDDLLPLFPGVFNDRRYIAHEQAECGLPIRMAILAKSYANRQEPWNPITTSPPEVIVIRQVSMDEHLAALQAQQEEFYKPITNGIVIDHLPTSGGTFVSDLLRQHGIIRRNDTSISVNSVKSSKLSDRIKDVLLLPNRFLSDPVMATIGYLIPEATFNIFREGTFSKLRLSVPEMIPSILSCPNPDCITNNDPEAVSRFWAMDKSQHGCGMRCDYCERVFAHPELVRRLQ